MKSKQKQKLLALIQAFQAEIVHSCKATPSSDLDNIAKELNRSYQGLSSKKAGIIGSGMQTSLLKSLVDLSAQVKNLSIQLDLIHFQFLDFPNEFSNESTQKLNFFQEKKLLNILLKESHTVDLLHPQMQDDYDFKILSLLDKQFLKS